MAAAAGGRGRCMRRKPGSDASLPTAPRPAQGDTEGSGTDHPPPIQDLIMNWFMAHPAYRG